MRAKDNHCAKWSAKQIPKIPEKIRVVFATLFPNFRGLGMAGRGEHILESLLAAAPRWKRKGAAALGIYDFAEKVIAR